VTDLSAFGIRLQRGPGLPDSRPKPWEGEPITPPPAGYQRLLDEFPTIRDGFAAALYDVVELHGPKPWMVSTTGTVARWTCEGCELNGYDAEYPDWPCETTKIIARHLGVELTE
jgi:hypothetical protein